MPRRAAAGAGGGTEIVGFAGRARLIDLALAAGADVVERRFARARAAGTVGQRFRAVHFVEMGLVDFRASATRGPPTPTSRASFARLGPRKGGGRRRVRGERSSLSR